MAGSEGTSRPGSPVTRSDRGHPDKKALVESWDARASTSPHTDGLIARLYLLCLQCLNDLVSHRPPSDDLETARRHGATKQYEDNADWVASFKVLKEVRYLLGVWGHGYDVSEGKLDEKLQASSELKSEVLDLLQSIGGTLVRSVARLTSPPLEADSVTPLQTFLDVTSFVTDRHEELCDSDSEQENDNEDQTEANNSDAIRKVLETLLVDVECLQELGPALECPFQDPDYDRDSCSIGAAAAITAGLPFTESIKHKYPRASPTLVDCLAERNMATFLRLQKQRQANEEKENSEVLLLDTATIAASSSFRDSGFASSVALSRPSVPTGAPSAPTGAPSAPTGAPSVVFSLPESRHSSYPSLPVSAKQGEAFYCLACGRMLSVRSEKKWRDHLISDLQPYICVFPGCSFIPPMGKQLLSEWASHLQVAHLPARGRENVQCPLCLQSVTHLRFVTHVGQHLEEIALAALPRECDSDINSVDGNTQSRTTASALTTPQAGSKKNTGGSPDELELRSQSGFDPNSVQESGFLQQQPSPSSSVSLKQSSFHSTNMIGGSPPTQRSIQSPPPDLSASEIEKLVQDRKRFLAHSSITSGTPLTTTYKSDYNPGYIPPEEDQKAVLASQTVISDPQVQTDSTQATMEKNKMGNSPPAQHPVQSPTPVFSDSELETLRQDRKRFLAHHYVTLGTPLTTTYRSDHDPGYVPPEEDQKAVLTSQIATSDSQARANLTQATIDKNKMGISPPAQHPIQSPTPVFSDSELETLRQDRKRFLAHHYVTLGTPLTTVYHGDPCGTSTPLAAARETFQTTVEPQEIYKVDDGMPWYAGVMNQRTGNIECVEVFGDTGTDVNWVSHEVVSQCNFLVLEPLDKRCFLDFKGNPYESRQRVKITLVGKTRKTEQTEFFVAPASFPLKGVLVGNQFINSSGHPHNVFLDEPRKVLDMLQKRTTEAEDQLVQVTGAQVDEKAVEIEQKRAERTQTQIHSYQPDEICYGDPEQEFFLNLQHPNIECPMMARASRCKGEESFVRELFLVQWDLSSYLDDENTIKLFFWLDISGSSNKRRCTRFKKISNSSILYDIALGQNAYNEDENECSGADEMQLAHGLYSYSLENEGRTDPSKGSAHTMTGSIPSGVIGDAAEFYSRTSTAFFSNLVRELNPPQQGSFRKRQSHYADDIPSPNSSDRNKRQRIDESGG
ncbi:MAG: hypothetical protein M1822_005629 [Bathelium mastoideum]|nr:MAG: hypothetical protein M1822_005629 [Bathelium mastoideum]